MAVVKVLQVSGKGLSYFVAMQIQVLIRLLHNQ